MKHLVDVSSKTNKTQGSVDMEMKYGEIKKASILGIIGNIFLLIIKFTVGFITNSQSMIADSANSAGDIFSSLMTFIGNKIASEPRDDTHNLGHGKAEYIFSMLISISMVAVAIKLLKNGIESLINNNNCEFSWMLAIVCIITIIVKMLLFLYTIKLSKKYKNLLIEANAKDHRNYCIVTTFTLIAVLLSYNKIFWFDGVVGIEISIWIGITGIKIFRESFNVLMDKAMDEENNQKVLDIIVDGNLSTFESHNIANKLEKEICEKIEEIYLVVVHLNPI